jgi:DNA-binding IclR family transcriptional regulator
MRELARIKETRLADDREEGVPGLACVASPVFWGQSSVVAAVSITGPVERFKAEHFGAAVKVAASGISRAIGSRYELMPSARR